MEQYLLAVALCREGVYTSGRSPLGRQVPGRSADYTAVHAVLFEKVDPLAAIGSLMTRAARPERDDEPLRDLFSR